MTAQTYTDAQKLFALDALLAAGDVSEERVAQAVAIYDSLPSQAARSVAVSDEDVRVAPWTDCAGAVIRAGYTIVHPSGERGIVEFDAGEERPSDQWRVRYENGERLRLCLQVGDKGRAVVTSPQSHGVAGAVKVPDVAQLYEAASKGFHTSETCGTEGRYMHVAKFPTIEDLFAFEHAWTKVMVAARDAATQEKAS